LKRNPSLRLSLLQSHSEPRTLHVADRFQIRVCGHRLEIIRNHVHVMSQNQAARPHEGKELVQIIDITFLVGINKGNVDRPFQPCDRFVRISFDDRY